jgi:hypothetical protein
MSPSDQRSPGQPQASDEQELVKLSTYTTPDVFRRLKVHAAQTGLKQHAIVTEALTNYLDAHEAGR